MEQEKNVESSEDIKITISENELEVYLSLQPQEGEYTTALLKSRLKDMKVTTGILEDVLQKMISEKCYGKMIKIAEGIAPVQGEDGWYEYMFPTEVDDKPKILADGSVDYTQFGDIPSVEEGAVIAKYHPSVDAKDGVNVFGEMLVATKGKNMAKLSGRGILCLEDGCTYVAKYGGKISLIDGKVFIDKEMVVEGDVTNSTGDITFRNDIRIRGNVSAGATIISEKGSILVDGYVEAANLQAAKDITLKNGMQGNGKGRIKAGGNVSGKFFEQSTVEAGGCVNANAIMNSIIKAGEDLTVSGRFGIIIGGNISAERQIEATIIGNTAEVENKISAGIEGDLMAMMNQCARQKEKVSQELEKVTHGLQKLTDMLEKTENPELLNKRRMLMRTKIEKDSAFNELEKQQQTLVEQMSKANQAKVIINKLVYPGTVISINGMKTHIKEMEQRVEVARRGNGIIMYHIGEG